jgi:hypothetical protein
MGTTLAGKAGDRIILARRRIDQRAARRIARRFHGTRRKVHAGKDGCVALDNLQHRAANDGGNQRQEIALEDLPEKWNSFTPINSDWYAKQGKL